MATKKKPAATVTRIKASSSKAPATKTSKQSTTSAEKVVATTPKKQSRRRSPKGLLAKLARPFVLLGGYFKGAWVELRQVRWPNRQATWSLTVAVLLFTAFFAVLILLLDAGFKYLFELILV